MKNAAITPAISEFTPPRSKQYQSAEPVASQYMDFRERALRNWLSTTPLSTAPINQSRWIFFAKAIAITAMAPRSSTVASASKKAPTPAGSFFLKRL
mmetsp:Transcript_38230/g.69992  ORF Transcript_38230/g.69992 Transcript_38230/m.69992 type:complete len:97 (+) Transcript_38230:282-572(+)